MVRLLFLTVLFVVTSLSASQGREIVDMTGRRVTVPDTVRRVYSGSPPATYLLYAIDPRLLAGINFNVKPEERRLLRPEFSRLPVAGAGIGQGRNINLEALLALKPDVVVMWAWKDGGDGNQLAERLQKSGIPTVFVDLDRLENYPAVFTFLGELVGRRERARRLANHARGTLRSVAAATAGIPERERVAVYYAEGIDGLATERETSVHAELIRLAGARNVHRGAALDHMGMEKVSLEQVLLYNPQVIVAQERIFFDSVAHDRRWQDIRAVRDGKVWLIPRGPFNWFDRPPSFMRLLGLKWLTNRLYPKRYPIDIVRETRAFYRLFLGVELGDRDLREILQP
ncbi:MAG: ABC transporter substrate-binding protein [Geobacter sp.]|nr:ABC transporter substrate-binding protein [Geobacter sp.]